MPQGARRPVRRAHPFDAPLHVDLVEAEGGGERAWQGAADVLAELPHGREVGQRLGVPEQVVEGDQGVGLAAAVGQFELPYRLVALPREPSGDVLHQLAQGVGRIGEGEELLRLLVHRATALPEGHLVQVGGEFRERQRTGTQLFLEADDTGPGRGLVLLRHQCASGGGFRDVSSGGREADLRR